MIIKEVIVVEGRDDVAAVKRAVDAEIIITHGFGITKETLKKIKFARERKGVIIFTDPDFAGERIRKTISSQIKGCKHAFLPREEAIKDDDIGIENATPESIRSALSKVRTVVEDNKEKEFKKIDLIMNDLEGCQNASKRRDKLGKILGIGYGNSKQFLSRLNNYGVTRQEFENALKKI
ncbi:RNAse M5 [Maledivibacter halophilus]|uniref:Ribonuclease M5 n=1 Tax=Maledivibacter halophilus TaxID=36842 RepID=A0A1T5M6K8_9FIRM|nr:ribonuclease M5 [Maledivibacter halophilus]SKC83509.1 RNAse M5 [Maledivibacter halophilus]